MAKSRPPMHTEAENAPTRDLEGDAAEAEGAPQIPGYVIGHTLGTGGTSAVYRAVRSETDEVVALKVLSLDHEDVGAALARLEREAHIGRALQHPDIVPVLDFGRDGETAWIAMELLDGFELTHALSDPSFGLQDRLNVVMRVGAALEYAHSRGVVHRDIKPSNIFMTRDGGVRLLDFGIAHVRVDLRLTRSGVIVGTPRYMAPEQVMGEEIDARTDVFSLGVVLYQTLTGAMPWEGESPARLIIEIATKPPRPALDALPKGAYDLDPEVLERLAGVVHTAIESHRGDRFGSMRAFLDALAPFAAQASSAPRGPTPTPGAWSQRRVDWALARAARLEAERNFGSSTPKDGVHRDAMDQTLADHSDRLWVGLFGLFLLALAGALYLVFS